MTWNQLQSVKGWPRRAGKNDYMKSLNGETLTRAVAIRAKCYECVAGEDPQPCVVETCPLSPFCQWNKQRSSQNHSEPVEIPLVACTDHCNELRNENGASDK